MKGYSILPPSFFTSHPFPHLQHNHSLPLYHPACHSTAHLSSFSVSVVPLWTHLPIDIVCAPSLYSFKKRLNSLNLFNCYFCWYLHIFLRLSCFVFLTLRYVLIRAAFILATWLGGFTLVFTTGVVQNLYKEKKKISARIKISQMYRRTRNFHMKKNLRKKFSWC